MDGVLRHMVGLIAVGMTAGDAEDQLAEQVGQRVPHLAGFAPVDQTVNESGHQLSAVARKSVILDGTSTTTCRGCMSEHRRQEPVWRSVRGAGVKAVSPAERGRSEATRLDVGEHTRMLLA